MPGRAKYGTIKLIGHRKSDGFSIALGTSASTDLGSARQRARILLDSSSIWSRIDIERNGRTIAREFKERGRSNI